MLRRLIQRGMLVTTTLLLLVSIAMWVRSFWRVDSVVVTRWREYSLISGEGRVRFAVCESVQEGPGGQSISRPILAEGHTRFAATPIDKPVPGNLSLEAIMDGPSYLGFSRTPWEARLWITAGSRTTRTAMYSASWAIPYWAITLAALILPAAWMIRRFRRSRLRGEGFCPVCGYDLRASPDRCPECGQVRPAISSGV